MDGDYSIVTIKNNYVEDKEGEDPDNDIIPTHFLSKLKKMRGLINTFNEAVTSIFINLFIGTKSTESDTIVMN